MKDNKKETTRVATTICARCGRSHRIDDRHVECPGCGGCMGAGCTCQNNPYVFAGRITARQAMEQVREREQVEAAAQQAKVQQKRQKTMQERRVQLFGDVCSRVADAMLAALSVAAQPSPVAAASVAMPEPPGVCTKCGHDLPPTGKRGRPATMHAECRKLHKWLTRFHKLCVDGLHGTRVEFASAEHRNIFRSVLTSVANSPNTKRGQEGVEAIFDRWGQHIEAHKHAGYCVLCGGQTMRNAPKVEGAPLGRLPVQHRVCGELRKALKFVASLLAGGEIHFTPRQRSWFYRELFFYANSTLNGELHTADATAGNGCVSRRNPKTTEQVHAELHEQAEQIKADKAAKLAARRAEVARTARKAREARVTGESG